mmetsp:Transcript_30145/g.68801  ORF Transcript_30145/g.68801 Transcript_30145/m.68801 type:complete len:99 (-) Transcript_30145:507-803(-)
MVPAMSEVRTRVVDGVKQTELFPSIDNLFKRSLTLSPGSPLGSVDDDAVLFRPPLAGKLDFCVFWVEAGRAIRDDTFGACLVSCSMCASFCCTMREEV